MVLNKLIAAFTLFSCAGIILSCGNENKSTSQAAPASPGQELYAANCSMCHGADGKLMAAGAFDLSVSTLPKEAVQAVIANGRGGMRAFGNELSKEKISEITDYIMTFRNK
ncbi:MAG: hypothetical protein Fur0041_03770 [Bacteroidia bacterium]